MAKAHTPGPWDKIVKMEGFTAVGANTLIARVFSTAFRDVENEAANARLIAAAPELLEVAQLIVQWAKDNDRGHEGSELLEILSETSRAIAKAEGK